MSYTTGAPAEYKCTKCGAQGCKLWRQYQTLADQIKLLCVECGARDQKMVLSDVQEDGTHTSSTSGQRIDQIGWLVPAVPTEDGETYWGYSSVPEAGVQWWKRLPLRSPRAGEREAPARRQEEDEAAARRRRDDDLTSTLISTAIDIASSGYEAPSAPDPSPDIGGGGGDFGGGGASGEW